MANGGGAWFRGLRGTARRWVPFNGGFGREQLAFMRRELRRAAEHAERVVILTHVVLSPRACDGTTIAWDYDEVLTLIAESKPTVAMVIAGHDHQGGYHLDAASGVHHLTLRSPLNEGAAGRAYARVLVFADRIELRGPRLDDVLPPASADKWPSRPPTTPSSLATRDQGSAAVAEEVIRFSL